LAQGVRPLRTCRCDQVQEATRKGLDPWFLDRRAKYLEGGHRVHQAKQPKRHVRGVLRRRAHARSADRGHFNQDGYAFEGSKSNQEVRV